MGIITIAELKPDMVLAEDLKALNGRFLLARGTKLTDKHLRIIKAWGVVEADIEGVTKEDVQANPPEDIDPVFLRAAENLVRARFCHTDLKHPAVCELYHRCALRKAQELARSRGGKPNSQPPPTLTEEAPASAESKSGRISPSEIIGEDITLSTLPVIIMQINEALKKPNSSAKDIANIISRDTSLSAKLLKLVNSAFYGYPSRIDNLSRAVLIVGIKQLSALAMGIKILSFFRKIPCHLIDMKSFLEHSVACGTLARILAGYKSIQNVERLFVGGLLHDLGRLIMYNNMPEKARDVLIQAREASDLLRKIEIEAMLCDHSRIGGMLLKKWKFPISLENIVTYHHAPQNSKDPLEPSLVHLADIMANGLNIGSSGERFVPPLNPAAWDAVGLSPNILPLVIEQMDNHYGETIRFLMTDD